MGPNPYDRCPYQKRRRDTDTKTQREGHVKTEAESGVMCVQAEDIKHCQ